MSKRPLIYEIIDNTSGLVLFSTKDKQSALDEARRWRDSEPESFDSIALIIIQNGKAVRLLASFSGADLYELLEDEI